MKPIDFVVWDGDSNPNAPVCAVAEAMKRPIIILGGNQQEYEVLSYYFHNGQMYLDIEEKAG